MSLMKTVMALIRFMSGVFILGVNYTVISGCTGRDILIAYVKKKRDKIAYHNCCRQKTPEKSGVFCLPLNFFAVNNRELGFL
jgi:hypothetical protein